jgi:signal transduction histidine kinase
LGEGIQNCLECEVFKDGCRDIYSQLGEHFNNMMHILDLKNRELKESFQKLKETQAQIIHQEKMASIGQLAAGIAHEINNPTGFVMSNLKTLKDYQKDLIELIKRYRGFIEKVKKYHNIISSQLMEEIKNIQVLEGQYDIEYLMSDIPVLIDESIDGATRIKGIVSDLKNFAHPGKKELVYTDINQNIESTLNIVWNELKYKAEVKKEYGKLPRILCYPQELNQVFMNILVNAAQAIEEKGIITIKTAQRDGYVEVKISDTGKGIPEENLSKVFDPFFTTKEVGKGTGLGLNVAYNIVKKHNGSIEVESTVGKGTTFTIRLPINGVEEGEL